MTAFKEHQIEEIVRARLGRHNHFCWVYLDGRDFGDRKVGVSITRINPSGIIYKARHPAEIAKLSVLEIAELFLTEALFL